MTKSQHKKGKPEKSSTGSTSTKPNGPSKWWHQGVRFECQGSGRCCTSRGEYGFVYLTLEDRRAMAQFLGLTTGAFTRRYCEKSSGIYHLKDDTPNAVDCRFLKNHRCQVYKARPMQCRTWPFWPENMGAKAWEKNLVKFCPGVGKGRRHTKEEIQRTLEVQKNSTQNLCKT